MLREDWGLGDTVLPNDFNNICKGINANETDIQSLQRDKANINHEHNYQKHRVTTDSGMGTRIDGEDLNNLLNTGLYYGIGLRNAPDGAWYQVQVARGAENFVIQTAYRIGSSEIYYRIIDGLVAKSWYRTNVETPIRLWEGSLANVNVDINLSDSIYNYKYIILNTGNVSGGGNTSFIVHPFNYLKGNIRQAEEMYIPFMSNGNQYKLYLTPSNEGDSLYYELRDINNTKLTSNPNTHLLNIRYIIGVK